MAFLFGAIVGSFLNVVIWRLPRGKSLVTPGSHCPKCGRQLSAHENIPLVSFLVQGAKCRGCKTPISWRYFWVELITAATFLAVYLRFGPKVETVAYCLFLAPLIAAFFTDVDAYLIPDQLHLFALFVGLSFNVYGILAGLPGHSLVWGWLPSGIWGGFLCAAIFVGIQVFGWLVLRKHAMGDGDVKLARAIGAMLPLNLALVSFFIAVAVGAVWGVGSIIRSSVSGRDEEDVANSQADEDGGGAGEGEMSETAQLFVLGGIYLLYIDALLFVARALRIPAIKPMADQIVPVEFLEDDDFVPGATHIPFGPFMVVGVLLSIFFGAALINWYLQWAGLK